MSMYQIEDLVECSIAQLSTEADDPHRRRCDIHYLYEFQNQFDCSFTHFRVLHELLDCGYILLLDPQQHPLYDERREEFEEILRRDFGYTPGASGGYWCGTIENAKGEPVVLNKLCCDYGSPLWRQLVAEGRLSGEDARPLLPPDPYGLVLRILQRVSAEEDTYLFVNWYSFFPFLLDISGEKEEAAEETKAELRRVLCQPLVFLALEDEPFLIPEEDILEDDEAAKEWFAPYFEWDKKKDCDLETIFHRMVRAFTKNDYEKSLEWSQKGMKLEPESGVFYLYWAYSIIFLQATEARPFDEEEHRKAIIVLCHFEKEEAEIVPVESLNYCLAVGYLTIGDFAQAAVAAAKAASLLNEYPHLKAYYGHLERKWREKHEAEEGER